MKSYKSYEEMQQDLINLVMPLSMIQEEIPPELFAPLADGFLNELRQIKSLYKIENNEKQLLREARYRSRLSRRGWRERIKKEFEPSGESEAVKEKVENKALDKSRAECINSGAVYAPPLDGVTEQTHLLGQTGDDNSPACLVAPPLEEQPSNASIDNEAVPVNASEGLPDGEV